jgi:hypothetical protein
LDKATGRVAVNTIMLFFAKNNVILGRTPPT